MRQDRNLCVVLNLSPSLPPHNQSSTIPFDYTTQYWKESGVGFRSLKLTLLFLLLHISQSCERKQKNGKPSGKRGITWRLLVMFTKYLWLFICLAYGWIAPPHHILTLSLSLAMKCKEKWHVSLPSGYFKSQWGTHHFSLTPACWHKALVPQVSESFDEQTPPQPTLDIDQQQEINFWCIKLPIFRVYLFLQYKPDKYPHWYLSFNWQLSKYLIFSPSHTPWTISPMKAYWRVVT